MKDQMRGMTPIADPHHDIRFEPTIVPFLLLGGFEMNRMGFEPHFQESLVQEIPLGGQPSWGGRVVI
jgi:hypothetical protein